MQQSQEPVAIFPIGDSAISIQPGNLISPGLNEQIIALRQWLLDHPFEGMLDIIIAYSSLSLYYDPYIIRKKHQPDGTVFDWMKDKLWTSWEEALQLASRQGKASGNGKLVTIPVCYDAAFGSDQFKWQEKSNLSISELVQLHLARPYRVYMIGFLPGFPYMGEIEEKLFMPRKERPVQVEAGSVGIAGLQTGIYPFTCPGGWNIIGRTPIKLFDTDVDRPVLLQPGDTVKFESISREEFDIIHEGRYESDNTH